MIFLFTDFGYTASYMGQMTAVLARAAPDVPAVTLTAHAPAFAPGLAAHLLAAEAHIARPGDVVLAVVDPGVGTDRPALALRADGVWFVGPDNGLLAVVASRARRVEVFVVTWRPGRLSASFHGRDLFAPVAAALARDDTAGLVPASTWVGVGERPDDLDAVVLIDDYGNAMTGRRAATLGADARATCGRGERLPHARTFADDTAATGFWYENAIGLAEISVRCGSAAARFAIAVGAPVAWSPLPGS